MSLAPVPSDQPDATCANCGSPVVADQRYCLSCGQPVSPVRLAFLDVLAPSSPAPAGAAPAAWSDPRTIDLAPSGYVVQPQAGANAWLRRNSGLLGLVAILALFLLAGLLIGHWVSQSKTPANTTVKIEGLGGLAAAGSGGAATTSTTPAETSSTATPKTSAKQEAKEAAEGEHETAKEKAPPPAPKKVSKSSVDKLTKSSGKKHQEEINALGNAPIETGG